MSDEPDHDAPPWAELLKAAFHAAYQTMVLEGEERMRAYRAAQRISDARMHAGRAVGLARRAGWDGNHKDLWKAAEGMAGSSATIKWLAHRQFLEGEHDRWHQARRAERP